MRVDKNSRKLASPGSGILSDVKAALKVIKSQREKGKFTVSDVKRLYPYLKTRWKQTLLAVILMIGLSVLGLPGPYATKYVIDDVLPAKDFHLLLIVIGALLLMHIIRLITSVLANYSFARLSKGIGMAIKKDLCKRILRLPLSFFDKNQTGYLMARIGEVGRLEFLFSSPVVHLLIGVFEFVFCILIMFHLHWKLTFVSLGFIPLLYAVAKYYSQGMRVSSKDLMEQGAQTSRLLQESLSGISVIKAFAKEQQETQKIHGRLAHLFRTSLIQSLVSSISGELLILITGVGGLVILGYGGVEIIRGNFTLGGYFAFTGYLAKLYMPTQMFASMGLTLQPVAVALQRVFNIFDQIPEGQDERRSIVVSSIKGDIVFDNVSFSYDSGKEVLHSVSFQINRGQRVAFVGPSGAGKSTILRLILGFYKAKDGAIRIDGQNINRLVLLDLRERIGIVSQNTFLFNDTIMNNILYSKPEAGEKEAIKAAKLADAHDFITDLPEGYHTVVGERGVILSGGQMQRISIARAILKNPDVIIFDEATSYLDNASERRIQRMMEQTFRNKTCIIVAHRLSTIVSVDKIFVIDDGRVVQVGTHDELIQKEGKYRELYLGEPA
ncbi:MAG: ABC transporter ATP-binding protein [Candidatus Latescibacteria bacterium]|nr:ABC transporter ATP-binding protein [Candidatus Latescibacterota bacterium]